VANATMVLDMAADGFGERVVVGAREGGLAAPSRRGVELDGVALAALRAQIRGSLRGSRTPERIGCWPELPRTATGKLVRGDVVARLAPVRD
jgi:acyl-coenzyme A synthetase/AMP-(fatty) acid ligase